MTLMKPTTIIRNEKVHLKPPVGFSLELLTLTPFGHPVKEPGRSGKSRKAGERDLPAKPGIHHRNRESNHRLKGT